MPVMKNLHYLVEPDKVKHIALNVGLTLCLYWICNASALTCAVISFVFSTLTKEIICDLILKWGTYDRRDIGCNAIGAVLGLVIIIFTIWRT